MFVFALLVSFGAISVTGLNVASKIGSIQKATVSKTVQKPLSREPAPPAVAISSRRHHLVSGAEAFAAIAGVKAGLFEVAAELGDRRENDVEVLSRVVRELHEDIASDPLLGPARIESRIKSAGSSFEKLRRKNRIAVDDLDDVAAIRVILTEPTWHDRSHHYRSHGHASYEDDVAQCYRVLYNLSQSPHVAAVTKVKDYVRFPKENGYQSLHVTCVPRDTSLPRYEIQIRTERMHDVATSGSASHDMYKEAVAAL